MIMNAMQMGRSFGLANAQLPIARIHWFCVERRVPLLYKGWVRIAHSE